MRAASTHSAPGRHHTAMRLEDIGFGSTLAVIAIAVLANFSGPAVARGAAIAQWLDHCAILTRTIAAAAFGWAA